MRVISGNTGYRVRDCSNLWYPCRSETRTQTQGRPKVVKKETLHDRGTARNSRVEREGMVVEIDRFGDQHVLGLRLSCTPLTEQSHNQNLATT